MTQLVKLHPCRSSCHSQRQRQAIKEHLDEFLGSIFDVRLVPDNVGKTMGKSPKIPWL